MEITQPKTLTSHYWHGPQSWEYEELIDIGAHRLRIRIDSDAYDNQSTAICERWDGNMWREVSHIAGLVMESRHGTIDEKRPVSYGRHEMTPAMTKAFESDRNQLLREARMVLGV